MKSLFIFVLLLLIANSTINAEYLENATLPKDAKSDWMELKSGEWVRGEFKGMYSGKVEFDSEEFDLVKFDLEDVKQIFTIGNSNINLNSEMAKIPVIHNTIHRHNEITGNLSFKNNQFKMTLVDGTTRILENDEIASISAGELKESNYWKLSIFLGVDTLSGNSEQITVTGKASAERRTALTRFRADYLTTYTKAKGDLSADNKRLTSSIDLYQTSHFYWRLATAEYLSDIFRNIDMKYTLGVGAGYDILYTGSTDWSITAGPGYQHTKYDAVEVGSDTTASTALFFLDSRFKKEMTSDIDFIFNYNMYYVNKESGRYTHHMELSLEAELLNDFTIDLSVFWDRVEYPVAFSDGSIPGQDDFKTMLAIGYSY